MISLLSSSAALTYPRGRRLCAILGACLFTLVPSAFSQITLTVPKDAGWAFLRYSQGQVFPGNNLFPEPTTISVIVAPFDGTLFFDVVDVGSPGDTYTVTINGQQAGTTSATSGSGANELDPDAAFANPNFSKGSFPLGIGNHLITLQVNSIFSQGALYVRLRSPLASDTTKTFAEWGTAIFSAGTPVEDRTLEKNPDGDDLDNGIEYLTGGHPEARDDSPFDSQLTADTFVITYRRSKAVPNGIERIQTNDGSGWGDHPNPMISKGDLDAEHELVTVTFNVTGLSRLLWRVIVPELIQ